MKERPFSDAGCLQHCSLKIVDDDFGRNLTEKLQGVLVSGQEVLCRFAQAKLDILVLSNLLFPALQSRFELG